jgi:hypothetical protein
MPNPMRPIDAAALTETQQRHLISIMLAFGDGDWLTMSVDHLATIGVSYAKRCIGRAQRHPALNVEGAAMLRELDRAVSRMGRQNDGP